MKSTKKHTTQKRKYTEETIGEAVKAVLSQPGVNNNFLASICKKKFEDWTPKMRLTAVRCLRTRLADECRDAGYDPEQLPMPQFKEVARLIDYDTGSKKFYLQFPYNWGIIQCLKDNIERKDMDFDGANKRWVIPSKFARPLVNFVVACRDTNGWTFDLTDTAEAALGKIPA